MIIQQYYSTRKDGVNLYEIFSDENKYIQIEGERYKYAKIIDIENSNRIYIETDKLIPIKPLAYYRRNSAEVIDNGIENN
jgi:hypothetical protein